MIGRPSSGFFPRRRTKAPGAVVLSVERLTAPPGVADASLELRAGEVLGIAGLVGSGRTELMRALFGLNEMRSGAVMMRGESIVAHGTQPSRRLRQGFGYLSEDRKGEGLALSLSVADNLTMTRMRCVSRRWGWIDLARQREASRVWIERLGIRARSATEPVRTLSGGNQQKVALGRLLHQDASVLLLDEPTRGIDVGSKAQVYEIIAQCAEAGKAILMVSSDLTELFAVCDRLAVMRRGCLSETRPIDAWTIEGVMEAAL
jgi:ribose transport system ATP-binding protein